MKYLLLVRTPVPRRPRTARRAVRTESSSLVSKNLEMLDPRILWSSAEWEESITDRLFSTFFCYVSSFFENTFILIDNQLKP